MLHYAVGWVCRGFNWHRFIVRSGGIRQCYTRVDLLRAGRFIGID